MCVRRTGGNLDHALPPAASTSRTPIRDMAHRRRGEVNVRTMKKIPLPIKKPRSRRAAQIEDAFETSACLAVGGKRDRQTELTSSS